MAKTRVVLLLKLDHFIPRGMSGGAAAELRHMMKQTETKHGFRVKAAVGKIYPAMRYTGYNIYDNKGGKARPLFAFMAPKYSIDP